MQQFNVLLRKELREAWRNFKFIWIPLVFLALGVSDPLVNYFMEDILGAVGNMPEGAELIMPELAPADLLAASTGQFQLIGIIVLIAAFAGMVSKERQIGTATLVYARPISYFSLFFSKWITATLIGLLSVIAGYGGSMYYTVILYGTVEWSRFFVMIGLYILWVAALLAVTLMFSAGFRTAIAASLAVVIGPIGLMIDSLIGEYWSLTPWKLGNYGVMNLSGAVKQSTLVYTSIFTFILLVVAIVVGSLLTKQNSPKTSI